MGLHKELSLVWSGDGRGQAGDFSDYVCLHIVICSERREQVEPLEVEVYSEEKRNERQSKTEYI